MVITRCCPWIATMSVRARATAGNLVVDFPKQVLT
jgi:hypothetical protein